MFLKRPPPPPPKKKNPLLYTEPPAHLYLPRCSFVLLSLLCSLFSISNIRTPTSAELTVQGFLQVLPLSSLLERKAFKPHLRFPQGAQTAA